MLSFYKVDWVQSQYPIKVPKHCQQWSLGAEPKLSPNTTDCAHNFKNKILKIMGACRRILFYYIFSYHAREKSIFTYNSSLRDNSLSPSHRITLHTNECRYLHMRQWGFMLVKQDSTYQLKVTFLYSHNIKPLNP